MSTLHAAVRVPLRSFELEVDLQVDSGKRLALVGPSGAGKTTILRSIAGLHRPAAGSVGLADRVWFAADRGIDLPPDARNCGFVFQDYALFPRMSVLRNVAYGAEGPRADRRDRAREMLDRFGIAHLADASAGSISGGERQRVALARALAPEPAVLLLDEPLTALDPATRADATRELDSMLAGLGVPILLVTHSFEEAALLAGEVAVIEQGRVVQQGPPAEVSAAPASPFVAGFAGASVLFGEASPEEDGLTSVRLPGGGVLHSTDAAEGAVAASVYPWEVSLEPAGENHADSALNRLPGEVFSITEVGSRARVGIALPEPLTAEITGRSVRSLGLAPGTQVVATWKATATRLVAR